MANNEQPKMRRLGSSKPELRPLFSTTRETDERPHNEQKVEESWATEPVQDNREDRLIPMILVGVAAVATVAALIYLATRSSTKPVEPSTKNPVATGSASSLSSAERSELAESTLRNFLAAKTSTERLKFVLASDTLTAQIEEYYNRPATATIELRKIDSTKFVDINGHPWCSLEFSDQDFGAHKVMLKEIDDSYLIDWESFVAYGEMPWDALCQERPAAPKQMRVFLAHTPYYNFKYSDPTKYVAFRIEPQGPSKWLYGYVERESALHRQLLNHVTPGSKQPLNVRLHFEPDAGADNLAIIDELIHTRWATPEILGEAGD